VGLIQSEQVQLLWKGFHPTILKEKILTQVEVDAITKELAEVLGAQPPPKLCLGYSFYVAQKAHGNL
jgi:hypothetical protein